jgi:hypothetical protein
MLSFVVFLFVGMLWSPSGGMETPTIQLELTRAACEADRQQFLDTAAAANDGKAPAFREGYGATPCTLVISEAQAKQS